MENITENIIRKFGGPVEDRFAACRDIKVANYLKHNICLEVKRHLKDKALLKNVEAYLENLIKARFSKVRQRDNKMKRIDKSIPIEELITKHPQSVRILMKSGIKCIVCGEPIWGTLEDAAGEKGFSDQDLDRIVDELNESI